MKQLFFPSVLSVVILAGCASEPPPAEFCKAECNAAGMADSMPVPAPAPFRNRAAGKMRAANSNFEAPQGRKMAFSTTLTLRVPDIPQAIAAAKKLTSDEKGYVRSLNDDSLSLAVPSARAEEVLQKLQKLGTQISLRIEGEDVTEAVLDLELRIENLKKSRARLLAMMDQTSRVDDLIQVESSLTRVTTELERLQSSLKKQNSRVDYVTMRVLFRRSVPETPREITAAAPLGWVNELGSLTGRTVMVQLDPAPKSLPFDCMLPAGFVQADQTTLVSGEGCVIALAELRNAVTQTHWYGNDYAGLDFYRAMIHKALKERFRTEVKCRECTVDGEKALEFCAAPLLRGKPGCYCLVIAVRGKYLYRLEACGEKSLFAQELPEKVWEELLASIRF